MSAPVTLRSADVADWPEIGRLADRAVAHLADVPAQTEWLEARRAFTGTRRQHLAVCTDRVVGYGAVERQQVEAGGHFRAFVVIDWRADSAIAIADVLLAQVEADLGALAATEVRLREYATDRPFIEFLLAHGFQCGSPYETHGVWVVTLRRTLSH